MNKRIQEFAHRCGFTEYRGDDGADDESLTKFAELIIRECCGILTENVEIALDASGSPVYPEGLIYEHFGVK